ncbi:hypothetical protein KKC91_09020 [bacterium]|nr:hypothetical protein [bacterium]
MKKTIIRIAGIGCLIAIILASSMNGYAQDKKRGHKRGALQDTYERDKLPNITQEQYISKMNNILDKITEQCNKYPQQPLSFRANLIFAHEIYIKNTPLKTLKKYVDALKEAGVKGIDINMGFFPWLDNDQETIKKYDKLIEYIRKKNLELIITPQYSAVYHRFNSFDELKEAAIKIYPRIAARFEPEIFIVLHKPSNVAKRMRIQVLPGNWSKFTQEIIVSVKKASPNTRLGASIMPSSQESQQIFNELLSIDELNVLSLNIYSFKDMQPVNKMITTAKEKGKNIYIGETWRPIYYSRDVGKKIKLTNLISAWIGDNKFQELDSKWLKAMAYYASVWGLEAMTPVWTQTFFKYPEESAATTDADYHQEVIKAINKKERTSTFMAFMEIIQQNKDSVVSRKEASAPAGIPAPAHPSPEDIRREILSDPHFLSEILSDPSIVDGAMQPVPVNPVP